MTETSAGDTFWLEVNVHQKNNTNNNEKSPSSSPISDDEETENLQVIFKMFEQNVDEQYETFEFESPNLPAKIVLRGQSETNNSTGLGCWVGAEVLYNWILDTCSNDDNTNFVKNKTVLELGAGLGLCGLATYYLGAAQVLLTDGDTDVLENLRYNVEQNQKIIAENNADITGKISCPQLIWGKQSDEFIEKYGQQDVIVASDVIYMEPHTKPLFCTVKKLLEPTNGVFYFCNQSTSQVPWETVLETATEYGLVWSQSRTNDKVYLFRQDPTKEEEDS